MFGSAKKRSEVGGHVRLHATLPLALLALVAATSAGAQPLASLRYASDISVDLGGGTFVGAGVLANDDLNGTIAPLDIANLPAAAHVAAAHRFDNGNLLLVFDSTVAVGGAGFVEPRDIVIYDASLQTFTLAMQGADIGIPPSAHIDAITRIEDGTTLISLDTSVDEFDDEDILAINGPGLSLYLDLSAIGIDESLDLDGLDVEETDAVRVYMSFDGSGTVDGIAFDDEDIVAYDLTHQSWSLAYDGSAADAHWPDAADLIGLDVKLVDTPTPTPTVTHTPTATDTASATPTATTVAPSATVTTTPASTFTEVPGTTTPTETRVPTGTAVATSTATATGTATETRVPTATAFTATATATETRVPTFTSAPATHTAPVTATAPGASATASASATPTAPGGTPTASATGSLPAASATATVTASVSASVPAATGTATSTAVADTRTPTVGASPTAGRACAGDCNGSGEVTINELITLVNIALGNQSVGACPAGDLNGDGTIAINEIVTAVGSANNGCPT